MVVREMIAPPAAASKDWKYEDRRVAQQLLPYLWIGPLAAVGSESDLKNAGIRVLICVMARQYQPAIFKHKYMNSCDFQCYVVDTGTTVDSNKIVAEVGKIVEAINLAKNNGVGALLFCESGNSMSAVAAAAYLIHEENMKVIQAIHYVQNKRFSVHLTSTDIYNLETCANLCQAAKAPGCRDASHKVARRREDENENEHENTRYVTKMKLISSE